MKKLVNQVVNEIFRQIDPNLDLALDVPVRPMDARGLNGSSQREKEAVTKSQILYWYPRIPLALKGLK